MISVTALGEKMEKQITIDLINNFSNIYNSNSTNRIIENAITENGLEKSCIDRRIIEENQPIFNIELPDGKRYDQKDNYRCWIYCGLNTIQYDMAKNLNIDLKEFALSNNYIAFFDKLEKSNNAYENIINISNVDWEYIDKEDVLQHCVNEGGHWQWFVSIVNKYGLMPYEYMPDVF
ncbi:Bleomycin hydrolase, partial [human gut metagenome]